MKIIKQKLIDSVRANKMILGIILLFIIQPLQVQSQTQPTHFDPIEFDTYVQQAMIEWDVPGLSIAVIKDDSVVFLKGYGVRELGKDEPVDTETLFAIGSTTKAFTAAAIGMLVDEGKLQWDDPVVKHLPWFQLKNSSLTLQVTIRDLLTHRTGLPNTNFFLEYGSANSKEEIFDKLQYIEPVLSLRSGFSYQNVMYAVAGELIESVSGMSWAEFIQTRIFKPLDMEHSVPTFAQAATKENVAQPHASIGEELQVIKNYTKDDLIAPAGSVRSSAKGMSHWITFLLRDCRTKEGVRLLGRSTCGELFTPQVILAQPPHPTSTLTHPNWITYGLGWFQQDYEGRKTDFHTGSVFGMSALAGMIRNEDLGIYVLTNELHSNVRHALMYRVFDLYDQEPARDWSKELKVFYDGIESKRSTILAKQDSALFAQRKRNTDPTFALEKYAGEYRDTIYGLSLKILEKDNELFLEFGASDGVLQHWHYDTFQLILDRKFLQHIVPISFNIGTFDLDMYAEPDRFRIWNMEFERVEKEE